MLFVVKPSTTGLSGLGLASWCECWFGGWAVDEGVWWMDAWMMDGWLVGGWVDGWWLVVGHGWYVVWRFVVPLPLVLATSRSNAQLRDL